MSAAIATPPPVQPAAPPAPVIAPATPVVGPPAAVATDELWRFSVADYHRLAEIGVLKDGDRVELLDGILVGKPVKKSPHRISTKSTRDALAAVLPAGWYVDTQEPVELDVSEPEPDVTVVRGTTRDYPNGHPTPANVPLVVEVAESSLTYDRTWKKSIYARNGIAAYWIVNLADRVLEVYSLPANGEYTHALTLTAADRADVVLDGSPVGTVAVADLLP
jgi:Uma2 family endonuclease